MHRGITPFIALAVTVLAGSLAGGAQVGSQDKFSAISGVVFDAATQKPIAGAAVQIAFALAPSVDGGFVMVNSPMRSTRHITDDIGRFVFADIAAGTYTLTATKFGYFDGAYGRRGLAGVNNQPKRVTLATGQWMRDARIEMLKPATIAGTVRNEAGEPVVGVVVRTYADIYVGGARQLAASDRATTDDRGEYRISSLAPGRYVIAVPSVQQSAPAELLVAAPAESQDALSREYAFRRDPAFAADPVHRLVIGSSSPPLPRSVAGKMQAYPLTFHPGVRAISDATRLEVAAGDEKVSIDVQLRPVPAFRVSGQIDGPADAVARMTLRLMAAGTETLGRGIEQATALVGNDGTFTFLNVPAGAYTLLASRAASEYTYTFGLVGLGSPLSPGAGRGSVASTAAFAGPPGSFVTRSLLPGSQKYQGRKDVVVGENDVAGVVVPVQEGVSVSGRIVYELSNPDLQVAAPIITAESANGDLSLGLPRTVRDADDDPGYFYIESVLPGSYLLRTAGGGTLKSITWSDKDYTNTPIEISGGQKITGVVITMTDRVQIVSGTIRTRGGQPAAGAGVVFFPTDRALWRNFGSQPTRIRYVPASTTGNYSIRGIPAGDYYAIGIDDAESERWKDPEFFEQAVRTATRFALAWGETKTVDVIVQEIK